MKRYGQLFDKAFSRKNIYLAYLDARKNKRKKRQCFKFETNLCVELENLHKEIHSGEYVVSGYTTFFVHEPKLREIHAPRFRDVVVQHAIYRHVYDIFNSTFIDQSFACRKGYGTHKCAELAQRYLRQCDNDEYYLKLDIRKFFKSIPHWFLKQQLAKKIKDNRLLSMMFKFVPYTDNKCGIPIGNLLSQLYALIVLNPLDHFVKRVLKIKKYVRYVDDFILFGIKSYQEVKTLKQKIVDYLSSIDLSLSKFSIQKVKRGINFVGYRMWKHKKIIRKYSLHKFNKCVKRGKIDSVISLIGHAKNTNSTTFMFRILLTNPCLLMSLPNKCKTTLLTGV
jgi:hypothetical protein